MNPCLQGADRDAHEGRRLCHGVRGSGAGIYGTVDGSHLGNISRRRSARWPSERIERSTKSGGASWHCPWVARSDHRPQTRSRRQPYFFFRRFLARAAPLSTSGGSFVHRENNAYPRKPGSGTNKVRPSFWSSAHACSASTAGGENADSRHLPHITAKRPSLTGSRSGVMKRSRAAGAAEKVRAGWADAQETAARGCIWCWDSAEADDPARDHVFVRRTLDEGSCRHALALARVRRVEAIGPRADGSGVRVDHSIGCIGLRARIDRILRRTSVRGRVRNCVSARCGGDRDGDSSKLRHDAHAGEGSRRRGASISTGRERNRPHRASGRCGEVVSEPVDASTPIGGQVAPLLAG
jgi:hypothetical protein